ncbi:GNAT family N-acetyltransferase [Microbacterium sp. zg-B96]|nr:GNAT family N-acetyltransferase [Microbacterium sp. zg-B96]MCR2784688.1 GNAT family N-acetyltransferase [Microbacterium sp. zg.B96]WIM17542.1 GNAT family N-acetyltransferase [Microbacterium sp. zg-B96]
MLVHMSTPEMTVFLGGSETPAQLVDRQERYLRAWSLGSGHMFRIDVDADPAGGIGYWEVEHDGHPALETGWSVLPEFQGRGVAGEALRQLIDSAQADGRRNLLVAYPGVDNPASNTLCRHAGFAAQGEKTMPWRGGELTFRIWTLAL